jgi:hypothetical protein
MPVNGILHATFEFRAYHRQLGNNPIARAEFTVKENCP